MHAKEAREKSKLYHEKMTKFKIEKMFTGINRAAESGAYVFKYDSVTNDEEIEKALRMFGYKFQFMRETICDVSHYMICW
jgi:hypothetical protein